MQNYGDRIITQIERTRDRTLQRAERIQTETMMRVESAKKQAAQQVEDTRKAAEGCLNRSCWLSNKQCRKRFMKR